MAAGLAHELNNPAAAVKRAASDMADALDVIGATLGEFVEAGVERDRRRAARRPAARGAARARKSARRSRRSTRPTPRTTMLERLEDLGVPEPWRLAEPLAAAGVDEAWLAEVAELAGPATGAALRWVAASLTARGLAAELHDSAVAHGRPGDRDQVLRLHGPRRRWSRSTSTRASRRRSIVLGHKLKHTLDRRRARLRPRAAAADRARLRAQPGVDEPHRQRHRRAGRERHPDHRDERSTARACSSTSPTTAPASRPRRGRTCSSRSSPPRPVGQGTGLGLDTARQIVEERHSGTLGFDTGAGRHDLPRVAAPRGTCADLPPSAWRPALIWTRSRSPSCPPRWPAARTACATAASGFTCASA